MSGEDDFQHKKVEATTLLLELNWDGNEETYPIRKEAARLIRSLAQEKAGLQKNLNECREEIAHLKERLASNE